MKTVTIELDEAAYAVAEAEARRRGISIAETVRAGSEEAMALSWDLDEESAAALKEGLAQANRGEFADDAEIEVIWANFGR